MKTLVIECPDKLLEGLDRLVRDGWGENPSQAVIEALRRFLRSHRPDLIEAQVRDDVEWGLHGND
jgi:metal-responsive CopG/Arc/MetJ family transcriptional regulator